MEIVTSSTCTPVRVMYGSFIVSSTSLVSAVTSGSVTFPPATVVSLTVALVAFTFADSPV